MAEAQAGYVLAALRHMRGRVAGAIEVRPEAQNAWNAAVQRRMPGTVWSAGGCASWYIDRTGANTTLWPGYTFTFRRLMRSFDASNYVFAAPRVTASSAASAPTSAPSASRTPSP